MAKKILYWNMPGSPGMVQLAVFNERGEQMPELQAPMLKANFLSFIVENQAAIAGDVEIEFLRR